MSKVILYPNQNGSVSMVMPFLECGLSVEEIAAKDTPAGLPYLILEQNAVPVDETFFDAWEADFSEPHGYGIGQNQWFINKYQAEIEQLDSEKDADQIAYLTQMIATQQAEKAQRELTE